MTTLTVATGTVSPTTVGMLRYVIGPLAGQVISGTVKCQMRGDESNTGANATPAMNLKIVQPSGADRAFLLSSTTASDSATAGNEFVTTLTNATFKNVSEVAAIPITTQTAIAGDYLVIELGFRSATAISRNIDLSYGDNAAIDLPIDTITTAANNPWFEFSGTITLLHTATGAETVGHATVSGTAQFGQLLTATGAETVGAATAAGIATQVTPVYTGAAAVSVGAATAAATGTVAAPVYTGAAAVTVGAATAAATGTVVVPSAAIGTAAVTVGAATAAGVALAGTHPVGKITQHHYRLSGRRYGTFSGRAPASGTYTASAAVTAGAATAAGTAAFGRHPVSKITQHHYRLSGRRYGSFANRGSGPYVATASVLVGAAVAAGVGSAPIVPANATAAVTVGHATASGSAGFGYHPVANVVQGTYALRSRRYGSFAGRGTGPYVAVSSVLVGAATVAGVASGSFGVFTATADVTVAASGILGSGQVSVTPADFATADGDVTVGPPTVSAAEITGSHPVGKITQPHYHLSGKRYSNFGGKGLYTATADVTTGVATAAGAALFVPPVIVCIGDVVVGAATASGLAAKGFHPVGKITQAHYHLSGKRYRSFAGKRHPSPTSGTGEKRTGKQAQREAERRRRHEREALELILMGAV